jgi:hypothetical protein
MLYALARHQSTGPSHVTPASPDSSHVDILKSRIELIGSVVAAMMATIVEISSHIDNQDVEAATAKHSSVQRCTDQ